MATKVRKTAMAAANESSPNTPNGTSAGREMTFDVFRRWGYLQTTLDPLGQYLPKEPFPATVPEGEEDAAAEARAFYCGTIGVEFMHIANAERREWIEAQMEQAAPRPTRRPS